MIAAQYANMDDPIEERPTVRVEVAACQRTRRPSSRRVLVIGPDFETVEALRRPLEELGQQIRVACSAADGIWSAREWRPHVVVCAVGHAEMDGYIVATELRRLTVGREPILIAVSGYHSRDDREWAKLAGFHHHLTQPLDPLVLAQLIAAE